MDEFALVDVMVLSLTPYEEKKFPQGAEKDTVYVSIHDQRIEIFLFTSNRRRRNLFALLKREGLFQPWNRSRPKLLKRMQTQGMLNRDITTRFTGVLADEKQLRTYLEEHFSKIVVVEQNRDTSHWNYDSFESEAISA
jgi:hypothetical protein